MTVRMYWDAQLKLIVGTVCLAVHGYEDSTTLAGLAQVRGG